MEFRILGPLEVWNDGRQLDVSGTRQRELLAMLLLHAGEVVSSDRLMDALWGEDQPAAGGTALRVRVSKLRRALGAGGQLLMTRSPGYVLLAEPGNLDLRRFERDVDEARRCMADGDAADALEHAQAALELWRGRALEDVSHASFARPAIIRLEELRAAAIELRVDARLALGQHGQVIPELRELLVEHPMRERMWSQLMLALYRDGRQAEALAAYRSARSRLVEEIGIEPGAELRALEARILAQDPGLDTAPASSAAPAPRRSVIALVDQAVSGPVVELAERLAISAGHELIVAALLDEPEDLVSATARLSSIREEAAHRAVEIRVVAFTSADRGADAVRLAAEQEAALLLTALPPGGAVDDAVKAILEGAVCDVLLVGGEVAAGLRPGPVLVPFAGGDHDWSAAELGAWLAAGSPLRLVGASGRGRDASRLLGSASLALQRAMGIPAEPVLVAPGAAAIVEAAAGAAAVVAGLSERWHREGIGAARSELAATAPCPVLLVRRGLRPSGLAPPAALTHFAWSSGS